MLSKLLSLLSTAKGAAAATAIAAAAVSTGVAATDQDVRDAVTNTIHNATESADAKDAGQPAVVTARNKADSDLRAAFHTNQQNAETAVAALPTFTPGKPADAGKPDNAGKPAELPAHP